MPESFIPVWMSLGEAQQYLAAELPDRLAETIQDALEEERPRTFHEMEHECARRIGEIRLLTTDEVAEILRITTRQVRRLAADGLLERVRLGAKTARYMPESVDRLIRARRSP